MTARFAAVSAPIVTVPPVPEQAAPAASSLAIPATSERAEWIARASVIVAGLLLAWYTWGHWGDVQVDCGRELYAPSEILKGRLLYRDFWYPYGPLAPYFQAMFYGIFGVSLTSAYVLGLGTTLIAALLVLSLSRRFVPMPPALVVAFFFLLQGARPELFNYFFPYSYAALIGQLLGLTCLYLCITLSPDERGPRVVLAGVTAGLALLCKPEFGAACFAVLGAALLLRALKLRSIWALGLDALACAPGVLLCVLVYGWFFWRLSARFILIDNFESMPGSYFMQTFGPAWVRRSGLRFEPWEIFDTLRIDLMVLGVWCLLALQLRFLFLRRRAALVICTGALLLVLNLRPLLEMLKIGGLAAAAAIPGASLLFPIGAFWLGCAVWLRAVRRWLQGRWSQSDWCMALLATYALATGSRIMVQPAPVDYAIYYDIGLFLVFIVFVTEIVRRAAQGLSEHQASVMLRTACAYEALLLVVALWPRLQLMPARLDTDRGTVYTHPAEARLYPQIVSFIKEQSARGKHVLILPEAPLLYVLSGTESPTRWYAPSPGQMSPEDDREFIREAEQSRVDFVLITNRDAREYGAPYFGIDYGQTIYRWIDSHYDVVGQIGEFRRAYQAPFSALIYKRRESPTPGSNDARGPVAP
jgi:hypothetical protein